MPLSTPVQHQSPSYSTRSVQQKIKIDDPEDESCGEQTPDHKIFPDEEYPLQLHTEVKDTLDPSLTFIELKWRHMQRHRQRLLRFITSHQALIESLGQPNLTDRYEKLVHKFKEGMEINKGEEQNFIWEKQFGLEIQSMAGFVTPDIPAIQGQWIKASFDSVFYQAMHMKDETSCCEKISLALRSLQICKDYSDFNTTIRQILPCLGESGDDEPLNFDQLQTVMQGLSKLLLILNTQYINLDPKSCTVYKYYLEFLYGQCQSNLALVRRAPANQIHNRAVKPLQFVRAISKIAYALRGKSKQIDEKLLALINLYSDPIESDNYGEPRRWAAIGIATKELIMMVDQAYPKINYELPDPINDMAHARKKAATQVPAEKVLPLQLFPAYGMNSDFIMNCLENLNLIANLNWAESTAKEVRKDLIDYYFKHYDAAHVDLRIESATLAQNAIPGLIAEVTVGRKTGSIVDRENFTGIVSLGSVNVTAGAKLGVEGMKLASVSAGVTDAEGSLVEYPHIPFLVEHQFCELVRKNRYATNQNGSKRVRYFCRYSMLGQSASGPDQVTLDKLDDLRKKYRCKRLAISQNLALLVDDFYQNANFSSMTDSSFMLPAVQKKPVPPEFKMSVRSGTGGGKVGPDTPLVQCQAGLAYEYNRTCVTVAREKPLLERLAELNSKLDKLKALPEQNNIAQTITSEKTQIETEIIRAGRKILLAMRPKNSAAPTIADQIHHLVRALTNSFWKLIGWEQLTEVDELELDLDIWASLTVAPTKDDAVFRTLTDTEKIRRCLHCMKQDFEYFSDLQRKTVWGGTSDCVRKFYKLHAVTSKEEWLANMQILSAYLYLSIEEETDTAGPPDMQAQLKAEWSALNTMLYQPDFSVNMKKVRERTHYRREAEILTREHKLLADLSATITIPGFTSLHPFGIQVSGSYKSKDHTNPLTDGDFIELEIKFNLTPVENAETIVGIMDVLGKVQKIANLPGLRDQIAAGCAPGGGLCGSGSLFIQWQQSNLTADKPLTLLSHRIIKTFGHDSSLHIPTPMVSATFHQSLQRSSLVKESYSSQTVMLFLLRYFHEYGIDTLNKETGEMSSVSPVYWKTVEAEQVDALKQLFLNIAGRKQPGNKDLHHELNTLHTAFLADIDKEFDEEDQFLDKTGRIENANRRKARKDNMDSRQNSLFTAAERYLSDPSNENYISALEDFKALMLCYSAPLNYRKMRSPLFKQNAFTLPV